MRWMRGLALAAWGGFFAYLLVSGRATTYIGPKTAWVVTLGALTLPAVALAYLWLGRHDRRPPTRQDVGANLLLVAPILLALMVPAPSLGALAVKNKRVRGSAVPVAAPVDGQIRLYEIAWAAESTRYARTASIRTRDLVDFVGFVSAAKPGGGLELSRFFVTCCAADATAYTVKVTNAPKFANDTWVRVQGQLAGRPGTDLTVTASRVTRVSQPANPYG
jgi:uncharacterized repeat protein (TIGR03943 family)